MSSATSRKDAEALLVAVIAHSPIAISLTRACDGKYVNVNTEWSNITGYLREEALGRTSLEVGIWPSAEGRSTVLAPMQTHGRVRDIEITIQAKDGRSLDLLMHGASVEFEGEPHYLMFLTDVTVERQTRAALRASEAALQSANERLQEQLAIYDLTERLAGVGHWLGSKDGGFAGWSTNMYHLAGFSADTPLTTEVSRSLIVEEDLPLFIEARQRMDGQLIEHRYHRADGSIRWLRSRMGRQFKGDEHGFDFGVVQDITDERVAREALQNQLDFIRKVTGRAPGMLYQYELQPDGASRFPFVSDGVADLFNLSAEEAQSDVTRIFSQIHPDDLDRVRDSVQDSAQHLKPWRWEFRIQAANGRVRWLYGSSLPERKPNGNVVWNGYVTDVSAQKAASEKLRLSEERFRSLTELSSDWFWEEDAQFRLVREGGRNPAKAGALDNAAASSHIGKTRWEVGALNLSPQDWARHQAELAAHATFRDLELHSRDIEGRDVWMSVSGAPMFDPDGRFVGYRGVGRDITGRKEAASKIEQLAFYDALTALPNRRLLIDRLQLALAASERHKQTGALLFIDLDNFKDLNDTQGHEVGDMLLKQVAQRLRQCVREVDTVARLGGDEFVVMIEGLSEGDGNALAQADQVGRKVLQLLNQPYRFGDLQHHSSPSVGVTLFSGHRETVDELLRRADLAMYQAKAEGRNTMRFFDPAMQVVATARAALEADLRQGLVREELLLHYQPIVDNWSRVVGFEALVRWQHPARGLVSPAEFIPLAEQTGLILPLGLWVMEAALEQLVVWNAQPQTRGLSVSVNVSARQFRHPDFARTTLELIRKTGANPYRLKLELTESLLVADMQDAITKMSELRAIGLSFALDDFGTGYSSLSYLKRLPLDQLKIDQSFVRDVLTDPNDAAIARTVLALAQNLDLVAVAEGVETQGQRDFLAQNGCKMFQGYLFGRPQPIAAIQAAYFAPALPAIG